MSTLLLPILIAVRRGAATWRPRSAAGVSKGISLWARDILQNAERFCKHIHRACIAPTQFGPIVTQKEFYSKATKRQQIGNIRTTLREQKRDIEAKNLLTGNKSTYRMSTHRQHQSISGYERR
jgi:hypothetical protein